MALFSNNQSNGSHRKRAEPGSLSIIAPDLVITGDLEAEGVIKVEGVIRGNITAGDQVLVATGATITGDVRAREAVVGGTVHGAIMASERVEVLATAVVTGNIATARIQVHEGGTVNGALEMSAGAQERKSAGALEMSAGAQERRSASAGMPELERELVR